MVVLDELRQDIIEQMEHFASILSEVGYLEEGAKEELDKLTTSALTTVYSDLLDV